MKIYKNKWFAKFARKEKIADSKLCEAIHNAERGLIDADYGGGVIKQRIARENEGKSGGYRSIVLFRRGDRSFFVYGFPKNSQDNISDSDVQDFKDLAEIHLNLSDNDLDGLVVAGKYEKVKCDDEG